MGTQNSLVPRSPTRPCTISLMLETIRPQRVPDRDLTVPQVGLSLLFAEFIELNGGTSRYILKENYDRRNANLSSIRGVKKKNQGLQSKPGNLQSKAENFRNQESWEWQKQSIFRTQQMGFYKTEGGHWLRQRVCLDVDEPNHLKELD